MSNEPERTLTLSLSEADQTQLRFAVWTAVRHVAEDVRDGRIEPDVAVETIHQLMQLGRRIANLTPPTP